MYCNHCGKEVADVASVCIHCGKSLNKTRVDDSKAGWGWWWIGFLIPLAGLLIYIFCQDDAPNKARKAGIGAIVGAIVMVVLLVLYYVGIFALIFVLPYLFS